MILHKTGFGAVEALHWGEGDEALVVLLHAAASGPRALAGLAERLAGPGRRVLAPALTGAAGAGVRGAADPLAAHGVVANWALGAYPAARRVLFGHSMGGLVAARAAAGRADLAALVLYEPIVMAALDADDPGDRALAAAERDLLGRLAGAVASGAPEPGIAAFVEAWNEVRWAELPAKLRERLVADAGRLAAETAAVGADATPAASWRGVTAPTTILRGDRSPQLAARMAERLAALLLRGRVRVLPGLGHMGPATAPETVAAAIEAAIEAAVVAP